MKTTRAGRSWELVEAIGKGGFGEVYRAVERTSGGLSSVVALKVLHPDLGADDDALRRFRDEARILARINHPALLAVRDLVHFGERAALVTELIEGGDLADFLGQGRSHIPPRALVEVVAQVGSALEAAWNAPGPEGPLRLVHRDLKPTNIRLGRHGEVRLLDFGIATFTGAEREARTATDVLVGSLGYMAPERFLGPQVTPAVDVFGLGAVLYEGLCGWPLHLRPSIRSLSLLAFDQESWDRFLDRQLQRLAEHPAPLVDLVRRCLAYAPAERPPTVELVRALETLADGLPGPALRVWVRSAPFATPEPVLASWTGRTLEEGRPPAPSLPPFAPAAPAAPAPAVPVRLGPGSTSDDEGSRLVWLAGGLGCTGSTLVGAALFGLLALLIGWTVG